jgi:hypothetical protein
MPDFLRYIGIDYSGAGTSTVGLPGLRVYVAQARAREVHPPRTQGGYWSRRGVAEWLAAQLREEKPTLVGIDHGFSFPMPYFRYHKLASDWPAFLVDFQTYWPTDEGDTTVKLIRTGSRGNGDAVLAILAGGG